MAHSFLNKRWISSLLRAQHSLAWSKAPLTQLLHSIPHLANDVVEEESRGRSSRKIWISQEPKELFRWNKKHFFIVFEGLSFSEQIKIW